MVGKPDTTAAGQYPNDKQSSHLSRVRSRLSCIEICCEWLASSELSRIPKVQQRSKGLGGEAQRTEVFVLSTNDLGFHPGPDGFHIHFGGSLKLNLLVLQLSHLDTWLRLFLRTHQRALNKGSHHSGKYPSGQKHLIHLGGYFLYSWWHCLQNQPRVLSLSIKHTDGVGVGSTKVEV